VADQASQYNLRAGPTWGEATPWLDVGRNGWESVAVSVRTATGNASGGVWTVQVTADGSVVAALPTTRAAGGVVTVGPDAALQDLDLRGVRLVRLAPTTPSTSAATVDVAWSGRRANELAPRAIDTASGGPGDGVPSEESAGGSQPV
jgi:hypothetical protein